jgi:hypothetical protein
MGQVWGQSQAPCSFGAVESTNAAIVYEFPSLLFTQPKLTKCTASLGRTSDNISTSTFSVTRAAERNVFRQFALFVCPTNSSGAGTYSCRATLAVTNSGGSHLGSDEFTLPELQRNLAIAVGILLLLWFLNWIRYRKVCGFNGSCMMPHSPH